MPTTTSLQAIPVPVATDAPDGPTQMTNLAKALEQKTVMTFASAAARTSAFTAAGVSPAAGMICYRSDAPGANRFEAYSATAGAWRVFGNYRDSVTLNATTASATFSSVPTYLRSIWLTVRARASTAANYTNLQIQVNGDASAQYMNLFRFNQNSAGSNDLGGVGATSMTMGYMPASTSGAGRFSAIEVTFVGWDATTGILEARQQGGYVDSSSNYVISHGVGQYAGAGPWTSITLLPASGSFVAGSEFHLVGVE